MKITDTTITIQTAPQSIKDATSYTTSGAHSLSNASLLKDDSKDFAKLVTGEKEVIQCDGSYNFYNAASTYKIPYMSSAIADSNGNINCSITLAFSSPVNNEYLSLYFADTYPVGLSITWLMDSTTVSSVNISTNKDNELILYNSAVPQYNKIVITFRKMAKPYWRLKITEIVVGVSIVLNRDLKNAATIHEFNALANELPIGKLEFTAANRNNRYYAFNPDGYYKTFSQGQKIVATSTITDGAYNATKTKEYYLETYENTNNPEAKFTAYDIFGVLDKYAFYHNTVALSTDVGYTVTALAKQIFDQAGFNNYTIDSTIANDILFGFIPDGTVRSALQHLCIANRMAVINDYGSHLKIYRPEMQLLSAGKSTQDLYRVGVLNGSIVQFEDGQAGTEMIVTSDVNCVVKRTGRNLSNAPQRMTVVGTGTADKEFLLMTNYFASLISGRDYVCSWSSDMPVGTAPSTDTNQLFLCKDKLYNANEYFSIETNSGYKFRAVVSGDYYLRLDNNKGDTTHDFWDIMVEYGSTQHPYEPYQGQTYNLTAGVPTKIPLLNGCNTVFSDTGNLKVEYRKKSSATQLPTDILSPTSVWPSSVTPYLLAGKYKSIINDGIFEVTIPQDMHGTATKKDLIVFDRISAKGYLLKVIDNSKINATKVFGEDTAYATPVKTALTFTKVATSTAPELSLTYNTIPMQNITQNSEYIGIKQPVNGITVEMFNVAKDENGKGKITYTYPFSFGGQSKNKIEGNTLITKTDQALAISRYWMDFCNNFKTEFKYSSFSNLNFDIGNVVSIVKDGITYPHFCNYIKCDLLKGYLSDIEGVG